MVAAASSAAAANNPVLLAVKDTDLQVAISQTKDLLTAAVASVNTADSLKTLSSTVFTALASDTGTTAATVAAAINAQIQATVLALPSAVIAAVDAAAIQAVKTAADSAITTAISSAATTVANATTTTLAGTTTTSAAATTTVAATTTTAPGTTTVAATTTTAAPTTTTAAATTTTAAATTTTAAATTTTAAATTTTAAATTTTAAPTTTTSSSSTTSTTSTTSTSTTTSSTTTTTATAAVERYFSIQSDTLTLKTTSCTYALFTGAGCPAVSGTTGTPTVGFTMVPVNTPSSPGSTKLYFKLTHTDGRVLEVGIDSVSLTYSGGSLAVSVPASATLYLYGKKTSGSSAAATTIANAALQTVTVTSNAFSMNVQNVINTVLANFTTSPFTGLSDGTVGTGTFTTQFIIGSNVDLRLANGTALSSASNSSTGLSGFSITGPSLSGTITVN